MIRPSHPDHRGFTLVELMIVIGILSVLAVVLVPNVLGARTEGEIAETQARITYLAQAVDAYERKNGFYPPDDFVDPAPERKIKVKADGINAGIESLVVFLCQKRIGRDSLADHGAWLDNTDGDKNSAVIPLLGTTEKKEVVDSGGLPLAYFCSMNGGFDRSQTIMTPEGDTFVVRVAKDDDGKPLGSGRYQIVSAGPDGVFGNEDDVTHPSRY